MAGTFADGPGSVLATVLGGGNVNAQVLRIGDTVRRARSPHSDNVHALLRHLAAADFDGAPRLLGIDAQGREVLGYTEGSGPPAGLLPLEQAEAAARLLRRFHDATAQMPLDPEGWARAEPDLARREVICHNDAAPYNMVFRDGAPVALIDLDLAGPGPRLRDLGYLAVWCAPLLFAGDMAAAARADCAAGCPRLRALAAAYGCDDLPGLLTEAGAMLAHMGDAAAVAAMVGPDVAARLAQAGHLAQWQAQARAFDAALPALLRAIR